MICKVTDIWKKYPFLTNSLWLSPDKINAELNNGFQRGMLLIFDLKLISMNKYYDYKSFHHVIVACRLTLYLKKKTLNIDYI